MICTFARTIAVKEMKIELHLQKEASRSLKKNNTHRIYYCLGSYLVDGCVAKVLFHNYPIKENADMALFCYSCPAIFTFLKVVYLFQTHFVFFSEVAAKKDLFLILSHAAFA